MRPSPRGRFPVPHALSRLPALADRLAARRPTTEHLPERPHAAVAVVLAPDPDALLLIRRAEREDDTWSGHLAFPGGRSAPGDSDLVATARREAREEVGVDLSAAPLLGTLDDIAPRTPHLPPIMVRPFVFRLGERAALTPNPEVADAWWVGLDEFLRDGVYAPFEFRRYGTIALLPGYHLPQGILWGMSERIVTPLLELLGG